MYSKNNVKLKNSKKGFVEITSFALLTLTIATLSIIAYFFVANMLDQKQIELERNNIDKAFSKLQIELSNLENFQDSSFSYPLNIKQGVLEFSTDELIYYSKLKFKSSETLCIENICYLENNGFEQISLKLNSPFEFDKNFRLNDNSYNLIFTNIGGNKIDVKFK